MSCWITKVGETEKYLLKYEKLPTFCKACGLMGHWHEDCGTGEHDETKLEWGSFILAARRGRGAGRGGRGGRQREVDDEDIGGGRGNGPGRGQTVPPATNTSHESWRFNALYQTEIGTGGSVVGGKPISGTTAESQDVRMANASTVLGKRTADDSTTRNLKITTVASDPLCTSLIPFVGSEKEKSLECATVAEKVNMFEGEEGSEDNNQNLSNTPQKNANKKKLRGVDEGAVEGNVENANIMGSAAPLEGDRWEQ